MSDPNSGPVKIADEDTISILVEDAKDKRSKEHAINLTKLEISYKILCWIFGLMITVFGIPFLYGWFTPNCVDTNTHDLLDTTMTGLISMATLILGYIAGSQLAK